MNEQREFWSKVARKYDRVVDLQIGSRTRSLVRERVAREGTETIRDRSRSSNIPLEYVSAVKT